MCCMMQVTRVQLGCTWCLQMILWHICFTDYIIAFSLEWSSKTWFKNVQLTKKNYVFIWPIRLLFILFWFHIYVSKVLQIYTLDEVIMDMTRHFETTPGIFTQVGQNIRNVIVNIGTELLIGNSSLLWR